MHTKYKTNYKKLKIELTIKPYKKKEYTKVQVRTNLFNVATSSGLMIDDKIEDSFV